jgi:hypothetical protein
VACSIKMRTLVEVVASSIKMRTLVEVPVKKWD